jgi:hypothetical protein
MFSQSGCGLVVSALLGLPVSGLAWLSGSSAKRPTRVLSLGAWHSAAEDNKDASENSALPLRMRRSPRFRHQNRCSIIGVLEVLHCLSLRSFMGLGLIFGGFRL